MIIVLCISRLHIQRIATKSGLCNHESTHILFFYKTVENILFYIIMSILNHRLEEKSAVDTHCERQRQ
ncbi:hypothetical protein SDC9_135496 [bioreactor metagenome]|uniref:Uncharacterized protein n=1 Tax=bioreactor metagenome TaxID=1076179 RepID=A0A645DHV0_9ZZZZ